VSRDYNITQTTCDSDVEEPLFFSATATNKCLPYQGGSVLYSCTSGSPIGFFFSDLECLNFVETFPLGEGCTRASLNDVAVYSETICYNSPGYYYVSSYLGLDCEGTTVSVAGYAAGSCVPYSKTESVLYDCSSK
jgi:hypothetical protein